MLSFLSLSNCSCFLLQVAFILFWDYFPKLSFLEQERKKSTGLVMILFPFVPEAGHLDILSSMPLYIFICNIFFFFFFFLVKCCNNYHIILYYIQILCSYVPTAILSSSDCMTWPWNSSTLPKLLLGKNFMIIRDSFSADDFPLIPYLRSNHILL